MVSSLNTCLWNSQTYCSIPEAGQQRRGKFQSLRDLFWNDSVKVWRVCPYRCWDAYITYWSGMNFGIAELTCITYLLLFWFLFVPFHYRELFQTVHCPHHKYIKSLWALLPPHIHVMSLALPLKHPESATGCCVSCLFPRLNTASADETDCLKSV